MRILGRKIGDKVAIHHGKYVRETCMRNGIVCNGREHRWLKGPSKMPRRSVATTKDVG